MNIHYQNSQMATTATTSPTSGTTAVLKRLPPHTPSNTFSIRLPPLPPRTAFQLFEQQVLQSKEQAHIKSTRVLEALVLNLYQALPVEQSESYEECARSDKARFRREQVLWSSERRNFNSNQNDQRIYGSNSAVSNSAASNAEDNLEEDSDWVVPLDQNWPPRVGTGPNWQLADQLYKLADLLHRRDRNVDDDTYLPPSAERVRRQARSVSSMEQIRSGEITNTTINGRRCPGFDETMNTAGLVDYFKFGIVLDLFALGVVREHHPF